MGITVNHDLNEALYLYYFGLKKEALELMTEIISYEIEGVKSLKRVEAKNDKLSDSFQTPAKTYNERGYYDQTGKWRSHLY